MVPEAAEAVAEDQLPHVLAVQERALEPGPERRGRLQPLMLRGLQLELQAAEAGGELLRVARAQHRHHHAAVVLLAHPVDRHLRRRPADLAGDRHHLGGNPVDPLGRAAGAVAARAPGARYLPVSDPPSSIPQGVTARSSAAAIARCSCSTSRSASDHGIWMAAGTLQPRSSATDRPRLITHAGVSEKPTWSTLPARTWSSSARMTSSTGVVWSHMCSHSRSTRSVPSRRRLASSERTRLLRWLPPALGSSRRLVRVYLVAITQRSLSAATSSPTMRSLAPPV